jgi:hypothetical protein
MTSNNHETRKHPRHRLTDTFVVNQEAVCQVLDVSSGGISFGCTSERKIPEIWTVDIIDNKGVHLLDFPVKTVWAGKNKDSKSSLIYEMVVGAQFNNNKLSPEQKSALDQLLTFLKESDLP